MASRKWADLGYLKTSKEISGLAVETTLLFHFLVQPQVIAFVVEKLRQPETVLLARLIEETHATRLELGGVFLDALDFEAAFHGRPGTIEALEEGRLLEVKREMGIAAGQFVFNPDLGVDHGFTEAHRFAVKLLRGRQVFDVHENRVDPLQVVHEIAE